MGIEGAFIECAQISKLLDKIPGNLSYSIVQGFHSGDRSMAIKASLNSWLNNPLTGTGPQNFSTDYLKIFSFDDYIKSKVLLEKKDDEAWVSLVCAHPAKFDNAVNKAINKEIDIPKELSNLFDKEEKMTILPNSTMDVKNLILEKINNA